MLKKQHLSNNILIALTIVGAILRFASIATPLWDDELSALSRMHHNNLHDAIYYGVFLGDTHPAGIHTLLWLWSRIVGTNAILLRLPFVLMSIACIPLLYSVARQWYNQRAGLIAATIVALSQYTITYSNFFRPYSAGLFFIVLMLYCWSRLLVDRPTKRRWLHYIGLAISAALCAYTHYFAMLTAALLGIAGLFFVKSRKEAMAYSISCLAAILLFLPHLYITLHQLLDLKGIGGWLSKPSALFLLDYIRYLCHFSTWVPLATISLLFFTSTFNIDTLKARYKKALAAMLLFLSPLCIGFVYSVIVNPCLQFSCLLFSFPFLILLLCSFVSDNSHYPPYYFYCALSALCLTLILTLTLHRQHFKMMQLWSTEPAYNTVQHCCQRYGADSVTCIINKRFLDECRNDGDINFINHCVPGQHSAPKIEKLLHNTPTPYIVVAGLWEDEMNIAKHYYPTLLCRQEMLGYEIEVRSSAPSNQDNNAKLLCSNTFYHNEQNTIAQSEYYTLFDANYAAIADDRFEEISTTIKYTLLHDTTPLYLVIETNIGDKTAAYKIINLAKSLWSDNGLHTCTLSQRMELPIKSRYAFKLYNIKIYLWNPTKSRIATLKNYEITLSPTNRFVYSHIEEL